MINTNKKTRIIEIVMICFILVGILIFIIIDYQNIFNKFKLVFIEKNGTSRILKGLLNTFIISISGLIIGLIIFASVRGQELTIAIIAYGLNSGAYVSEILRGGINAVPKGQLEAGLSLGLSYNQTMEKIIIPQAIRNAFPSIGNEFISLIKETSIVGFIGAVELTKVFKEIATATFQYTMAYLIMGIIYFIIVLIISKLFQLFEMRILNYD